MWVSQPYWFEAEQHRQQLLHSPTNWCRTETMWKIMMIEMMLMLMMMLHLRFHFGCCTVSHQCDAKRPSEYNGQQHLVEYMKNPLIWPLKITNEEQKQKLKLIMNKTEINTHHQKFWIMKVKNEIEVEAEIEFEVGKQFFP